MNFNSTFTLLKKSITIHSIIRLNWSEDLKAALTPNISNCVYFTTLSGLLRPQLQGRFYQLVVYFPKQANVNVQLLIFESKNQNWNRNNAFSDFWTAYDTDLFSYQRWTQLFFYLLICIIITYLPINRTPNHKQLKQN